MCMKIAHMTSLQQVLHVHQIADVHKRDVPLGHKNKREKNVSVSLLRDHSQLMSVGHFDFQDFAPPPTTEKSAKQCPLRNGQVKEIQFRHSLLKKNHI